MYKTLIVVFIFYGCNENQNDFKTEKANTTINSFLFLKYNMTSKDVFQYLDSNKISRSNLKSSDNLFSSIEIYNLKVEDAFLDTSTVLFYKNHILNFSFHHINHHTYYYWIHENKNPEDLSKPIPLIKYEKQLEYCAKQLNLFYYGLQEKYGEPKIIQNSGNIEWENFDYNDDISCFMVCWFKKENLVKISINKVLNNIKLNPKTMREGEEKSFSYEILAEFKNDDLQNVNNKLNRRNSVTIKKDKVEENKRKKKFQDLL